MFILAFGWGSATFSFKLIIANGAFLTNDCPAIFFANFSC